MKIPPTKIRELQKVCDVYDIFDPAVDYIIRNYLRDIPMMGRRTWEFAMIFLALSQAGKINPKTRGLAMGAGIERLIYTIAEQVKEAVITDLYYPDKGWVDVRTLNPQKHIVDAAPWPVPENRIKVLPMDMRKLNFPDNSFDFAWSTGSFEHIGHDKDFMSHFEEVYRVLKPGGVYAFTTAVIYADDSERIPGNYYFHPDHLIDLVHRSPLHPNSAFDCTVKDHHYNRPLTERSQDFGFSAGRELIHPFIAFRRGTVTAANLIVLTKKPGVKKKPKIVGFSETKARLNKEVANFTKVLWEHPQNLAIEPARKSSAGITQWQYFGKGKHTFHIGMIGANPKKIEVSLRSRTISYPLKNSHEKKMTIDGEHVAKIEFTANPKNLYRIVIKGNVDHTRLFVRAGASKQLKKLYSSKRKLKLPTRNQNVAFKNFINKLDSRFFNNKIKKIYKRTRAFF